MQYRDRHLILLNILELLDNGDPDRKTKTGIMYASYISFYQLKDYMEFLLYNGWMKKTDRDHYGLTAKGKKKLLALRELNRLLPLEQLVDFDHRSRKKVVLPGV